jgi:ribosome-binding protein aMBF1 (putative translation factor)
MLIAGPTHPVKTTDRYYRKYPNLGLRRQCPYSGTRNKPAPVKKSIYNDHYLELIARIRAVRQSADISQQALAAKLGRPQSYVSKIESGERRIDVIETLELCRALDIKLTKLVPENIRYFV